MIAFPRTACFAVAMLVLADAAILARAQETTPYTNAPSTASPPSWAPAPLLTTNAAASTFLENHPELAQRSNEPQKDQNLSLRSGNSREPSESLTPSQGTTPPPFHFLDPQGQPGELAAHLLVVYNANDPDSMDLAGYYARKRNIPTERVLGITCPLTEEINRQQYDDLIREPIISYICQKNWMTRQSQQVRFGNRMLELLLATHNDIWAIVLMRGVPLKIAPDPQSDDSLQHEPELQTNAAAVDSELALLPVFGLPRGGYLPNPFFDAKGTGLVRAGPELATKLILVTRLDGPKASDVRRMIDDSLYAEKIRLAGLAVLDSRGLSDVKDGYTLGDVWLRHVQTMLTVDGWSVDFDAKSDVLPATDPCNQVALYLGWYTGDAVGPWVTPPNRFVPGAIAYHLHSFSASTVRSATNNWVGPLIAHGAAATMGTVYEPYLALTPHLDIFTKRLLEGNSFAEAAYASEMGLSWMVTVVGDPLYRPFAQPLDAALTAMGNTRSSQYDWLLLQQVQRALANGRIAPDADTLNSYLNTPGAGLVSEEGLADLLERTTETKANEAAIVAYQKAVTLASQPIDRIRIGLKLAQVYSNHGQEELAQNELKVLRELYPQQAQIFGVAGPLMPTTTVTPNGGPAAQPLVPAEPLPTPPGPPKPPRPQ